MINDVVIDDPAGLLKIDHTPRNTRQHVGCVDECKGDVVGASCLKK